MKKRSKKNQPGITTSARPEVIEALEELQASDEPHTVFYESLEAHRVVIVSDLESMMKNDEENKIAEF